MTKAYITCGLGIALILSPFFIEYDDETIAVMPVTLMTGVILIIASVMLARKRRGR